MYSIEIKKKKKHKLHHGVLIDEKKLVHLARIKVTESCRVFAIGLLLLLIRWDICIELYKWRSCREGRLSTIDTRALLGWY